MIFENYPFQDYQTVRGKKMKKLPKWTDNITQYALEIDMEGSEQYKRCADSADSVESSIHIIK